MMCVKVVVEVVRCGDAQLVLFARVPLTKLLISCSHRGQIHRAHHRIRRID
jgi:hypothetical protein